jgi:plastocyanin
MRAFRLSVAILCWAGAAQAADLSVRVTAAGGASAANAVVMVRPRGEAAHEAIRFPWPYVMSQRNMQLDPFVLIVPVGAEVSFPNRDPFRHHVYSFSPAKSFELKLYGHDETRRVKFDKPGVVALGCNIHDSMSAFVRVVDTPYAAKTAAHGEAVIHDLPPGPATVTLWHPYLSGGEVVRSVVIPASGTLDLPISVSLGRPPMRHEGY